MAKFTDIVRNDLIAYFEIGDQPTQAQFTELITAIQEGIEEHDHDGTGDGDGVADLVGPVGIGTATIPHGGVGRAIFAIEGVDVSEAAGPHIQYTTNADNFPVLSIFNWSHDDISLSFDAYYQGGWKSSDIGSNAQLRKTTDQFQINYESGQGQGGVVTWASGIILDLTTGNVGIGCVPGQRLHISGPASPVVRVQDTTNDCFIDMFCGNTIGYIGTGSAHEVIFLTNSHSGLHLSAANPPVCKIPSLAGVGARAVVAAADGTLSAP